MALIGFIVIGSAIYFFINIRNNGENKIHHYTSKDGVEGEYMIYPVSNPKGVLVWLHGDGAYELSHPDSELYLGGDEGIKKVAKDKHLTLIVPKTPADDNTWWKKGKENSKYLVELISSIPNHDRLWIGSFSGGSEMTTHWLLEQLPKLKVKEGGAVLFGGGGSPKKDEIANNVKKEEIVSGTFPLTWIVGENDYGIQTEDDPFSAIKTSKEGQLFYEKQGWKTERKELKGHEHVLSEDDIGLYGYYLKKYIN